MTQAQKDLRKQLLCKIHIHPKHKEIKKNDAWEDFLIYHFGVPSAKWLSISELNLVIEILNGKEHTEVSCDILGRNLINPEMITQKQITQILALQESLGWSDFDLLRFVLKQAKCGFISVNSLVNLTKKQASKVITGLEKIAVGYVKKKDRKNL